MTQLCLMLVILLHQPSKCCVTDRHHNTSLGGPLWRPLLREDFPPSMLDCLRPLLLAAVFVGAQ